jgi:hypothetical protein
VKKIIPLLVGVSIFAVTACSSVSTTGSTVALQYSAGPFDTKQYQKCWSENQKSLSEDAADDYFYYPAGTRDYDFGDGEGKDAAAFTSTTKDNIELKVQGVVKFELNTECEEYTDPTGKKWPGGVLQYMHENITNQKQAYGSEDGNMNQPQWSKFLTTYLGAAADKAVDNSSLRYGHMDLYNNLDAKAGWEGSVKKDAEEIVKTLTKGVPIFRVEAVVLQKPTLPDSIVAGLKGQVEAELANKKAETELSFAKNFPGGIPAYQEFQKQQAVNEAIKSGNVKVIPVPAGSDIIVNAG